LIDNRNKLELLYISITSSSINWGEKLSKKNRVFKAFSVHKTQLIENAYQAYLFANPDKVNKTISPDNFSYKSIKIDEEYEVDFERMVILVDKKELPIEREFAPSLYVNFFKSDKQTTLHLMIHKLQIDNQLYNNVFPVAFGRVALPKSVALNTSTSKPFIELSLVQSHNVLTETNQIKYFKVLMQEFFIKLDLNFLNALSQFVSDNVNYLFIFFCLKLN
jgi:vacuolar protein sorting-associated protein 13A/C